ncbi:MAG: biosynthetic-type acetolactate synthase large subunit [Actinobacteria bacterium]|nr:biosynthetic-type acetolactate synthase large subunit [Actinomycetota bacterium]MBU1944109.1 biosynthetic-type acetolactate synthase large subunit [Actinomycetota bacterium]MBU2687029.1 biosynthetic-type acetolactate synthase large subunit [Actinomycetota bacterium]
MKMTGAQAIIKSLENEGVEVIFGYPGGQIMPVYDVLLDSKIRHILTRHEQGAAHAADGYARATGKVGVCMATSGPGATNLVTGIATAAMDSIPLIAISGQVATHVIGTDAFQEADTTGITLPIVKHSFLVKDPADIPETVAEAFLIASTGRKGPVVIDLPSDVSRGELDFKVTEKRTRLPGYKPTTAGHARQIKAAAKMILAAKKPVIYAGGGVIAAGASNELRELSRLLEFPVTTTLLAKGAFPETHRLSLGMLGMHGTSYANYVMMEADLIVAVGARFDDRITGRLDTFAPHAKKIHIDIDPAEIGKNVPVDVPIVGDARGVLKELIAALKPLEEGRRKGLSAWHEQIKKWKKEYPLVVPVGDNLKPQFVIDEIYRVTKGDAIVVTDVGQQQMWAAQFYKTTKPRYFISSGGLGTMGFGLPASIGAKIGRPEATVVTITGDGSIQMNSQELATAVLNEVDLTVAIINNGYLGMVRQWQELFFNRRYSHTNLRRGESPDFVKLVEAYGGTGMRVFSQEEVEPALKKALKTRGPVLIDFIVEQEENVFPMVAPGASLDDMIGG